MILVSSWSCLCPIHCSWVSSIEWRCSWSSADRRCSNFIWVIHNLIDYQGASYIKDLTVVYEWIRCCRINSSWPSEVILQQRSGSIYCLLTDGTNVYRTIIWGQFDKKFQFLSRQSQRWAWKCHIQNFIQTSQMLMSQHSKCQEILTIICNTFV